HVAPLPRPVRRSLCDRRPARHVSESHAWARQPNLDLHGPPPRYRISAIHAAISSTTCTSTLPGVRYSLGRLGPVPAMKRWLSEGYDFSVTLARPDSADCQPSKSAIVTW